MRAVVQRVKKAEVKVGEKSVGKIEKGILIFLGIAKGDTEKDCEYLANKIANLRIFPDDQKLMNKSLIDVKGAALIVSQFTLLADCRKGRRPSFTDAAEPEKAKKLYDKFVEIFKNMNIHVETGIFQEMMEVHLVNDGPVTMLLDSTKLF